MDLKTRLLIAKSDIEMSFAAHKAYNKLSKNRAAGNSESNNANNSISDNTGNHLKFYFGNLLIGGEKPKSNQVINGKQQLKSNEISSNDKSFENEQKNPESVKNYIKNNLIDKFFDDDSNKQNSKKKEVNVDQNNVNEANMTGNSHIADQDPNIIDLGFGVKMDMNAMSGNQVTPNPIPPQQGNSVTPNPIHSNNIIPNMNQNIGIGFAANSYLQHLEQKEEALKHPAPGQGRHKVDNPVPQKPPVQKAEADDVNVDLNVVHVPTNPPKPPKEWPDAVANPLPQADYEPPKPVPAFDNRSLIERYKYLGDIERIALECGAQVQMIPRATFDGKNFSGLISVITYTDGNPKPNPLKGFTIDTGVIIDHRAKVFPAILAEGYEDLQAYPVLIPNEGEKGKGKSKNVINEKLFRDIFIGGMNMLEPKNGMYTPDYLELNKFVAIITMPTNNMNGDTRREMRNRLKAAMNAGVFASALANDPNSRFRITGYNKKSKEFTLTNEGVPFRFGGPVLSTKPIKIHFKADGTTTIESA